MTPTIEDVLNDLYDKHFGSNQELGYKPIGRGEMFDFAKAFAASLNRQGCRWVKASERRPTKEKFYYAEDSVGNRTMIHFWKDHWHSLTVHPVAKWYDDESIEPCATSSERENRKIFLGEMLSIVKEVAVDFYWENNINHRDGYQKFRQEFDEWFKNNKYINTKLLSESPSPTGDRDCEELKKEVERLKGLVKENYFGRPHSRVTNQTEWEEYCIQQKI